MDRVEICIPKEENRKYRLIDCAVKEGSRVKKDEVLGECEIIDDGEEKCKYTIKAPNDGAIKRIVAAKDVIIDGGDVVMILEEDCDHSIQVKGICAICGIDVNK